jgi:hypothetical protein
MAQPVSMMMLADIVVVAVTMWPTMVESELPIALITGGDEDAGP